MTEEMKNRYRYCGHLGQLFGWQCLTVDEGPARGSRLVRVWTEGGAEFDLWPDNGLDIGAFRFRGMGCCYLTKNGFTSPYRQLNLAGEFDHSFSGGMLYTCGLMNVGPDCLEGETFHALHGRYHGLSCEQFSARVEGEAMVFEGVVRESVQWGHNLQVNRRITVPIGGAGFRVDDEVVNCTSDAAQIMMLYHVNFGHPFLTPETTIQWPSHQVTPRTPWAQEHLATQASFEAPQAGIEERVYFNEAFERAEVKVSSPSVGVSAQLRWSQETLPRLSQWKTTREGEYCLALEPSTCFTAGRAAEGAQGTLVTLEGFGRRHHWVELEFGEVKG